MTMIDTASHFMSGAIMICGVLSSLFFLKFWKSTKDPLFGFFAASFLVMALVRICLTFASAEETKTGLYWLRFLAFILIIFAIIDKNRPRKQT